MELLNGRRAPAAVVGVVSLLLMAPGCGGSNGGGHANADPSRQAPSVPAAATVAPPPSATGPASVSPNACHYNQQYNPDGWRRGSEYASAVERIAKQYGQDATTGRIAVVDCGREVTSADAMSNPQITVAGAGNCAILGTVEAENPGNQRLGLAVCFTDAVTKG